MLNKFITNRLEKLYSLEEAKLRKKYFARWPVSCTNAYKIKEQNLPKNNRITRTNHAIAKFKKDLQLSKLY